MFTYVRRPCGGMPYETAARANEILALNVEDLDLGARKAVVRGKGGHRREVVWASGTARLLPRYLGGRRRGPVFVTHRRPNQAPALPDLCLDTGRGRLSYQQAWALFRDASGLDAAPAAPLCAHPPGGEGSRSTAAEGEKPPLEPAQPWIGMYGRVSKRWPLTAEYDPSRRYPGVRWCRGAGACSFRWRMTN